MAQILNGRELARRIREKIKKLVQSLPTRPGMAAILVGEDPASHLYVGLKERACQAVGISFKKLVYPADVSQEDLIKKIHELNDREDVNGILVQVPLPNQNEYEVIGEIDPKKDVDGFHKENLMRLEQGLPGLVPPVALGIMKLIGEASSDLKKKNATLICSEIFGKPLAALLKEQGANPVILHPDSPDLPAQLRASEIIVIAVGRPRFLKGEHLRPGVIVIDVGTTRVEEKVIGDVDQETVQPIAGHLTPVPGGVGPMTVAMLMVNVVKAYLMQRKR